MTTATTPTNMMPSSGAAARPDSRTVRPDEQHDSEGQKMQQRVSEALSAPGNAAPEVDDDRQEGLKSVRTQLERPEDADSELKEGGRDAGRTVKTAKTATSRREYTPGPPAITVKLADLPVPLPGINEKYAEAYRLKLQGMKVDAIAEKFGVDRSTCYRWIERYEKQYREALESKPSMHVIAEEVAKLDAMEEQARKQAEQSQSERQKASFLTLALKVMRTRQQLLLDVGILPKSPERLYAITADMKPTELAIGEADENLTRDQAIERIVIAMQRALTI